MAARVLDEAGVDAGAAHAHLRVQALLVALAPDRLTCRMDILHIHIGSYNYVLQLNTQGQ